MSGPAPVVLHPRDVPELRGWMVEQWKPGRAFSTAVAKSRQSVTNATRMPAEYLNLDNDARGQAEWELAMLTDASLWWVARPMVDLLVAAMPGVPDDTQPLDLVMPDSSGLVVFERPIMGHSSTEDAPVIVDGIVWGTVRLMRADGTGVPALRVSSYRRSVWDHGLGGHELTLAAQYVDLARQVRIPGAKAREMVDADDTSVVWVDRSAHESGMVVPGDDSAREEALRRFDRPGDSIMLAGHVWYPLGCSDWPIDHRCGDDLAWFGTQDAQDSAREDRRLIAALFGLLGQPALATVDHHPIDRAARRRDERARLRVNSSVRVVTLRHPKRPASGEQGTVHHDHRWIVRGHWRWQPHGPGRSERRLQWIAPHVKGPDDAPLVVRETVNAWVR